MLSNLEPGEVVVTNINYTRLPPAMQRMLNQSSFTRMEMSCDHPGCNYSAEDRASLMLHKFCKKNHLYCLKCDLLFEKKEYLFLHLLIGIGHSEVCPCCAKEFDTRETLRDHGLIVSLTRSPSSHFYFLN